VSIVLTREAHVGLHLLLSLANAENPNRGQGQPAEPPPASATEFEWRLQELGLTNETCVSSVQLRTWCAQNNRMAAEGVADAGRSRPQQRSLRTRTGD
jgi:hypothetical protein